MRGLPMKDKVIFITGANGGLGTSVTNKFLESGATVIGGARKITSEEFPSPNFAPIPVDLTNDSAVRGAVDSIIQRHRRLDVLVHVLGGFAGGKSVAETDDATWNQMSSLNLNSAFSVFRAT